MATLARPTLWRRWRCPYRLALLVAAAVVPLRLANTSPGVLLLVALIATFMPLPIALD